MCCSRSASPRLPASASALLAWLAAMLVLQMSGAVLRSSARPDLPRLHRGPSCPAALSGGPPGAAAGAAVVSRSRCAPSASPTLAGTATTASAHVGRTWSGVLAGAARSSCPAWSMILQPRIGGPAAAAVIANSVIALLGLGLAIAARPPDGRAARIMAGARARPFHLHRLEPRPDAAFAPGVAMKRRTARR